MNHIASPILLVVPMLQASDPRRAFEAKGQYLELMQRVPPSLILHPQPGLMGARYRFLQSAGLEAR